MPPVPARRKSLPDQGSLPIWSPRSPFGLTVLHPDANPLPTFQRLVEPPLGSVFSGAAQARGEMRRSRRALEGTLHGGDTQWRSVDLFSWGSTDMHTKALMVRGCGGMGAGSPWSGRPHLYPNPCLTNAGGRGEGEVLSVGLQARALNHQAASHDDTLPHQEPDWGEGKRDACSGSFYRTSRA